MATRSNIIVDDGYDRIQLYRHWDGHPGGEEGVLATLKDALPYACSLPWFEASDFAAALVRAWKGRDGGNVYIDGSPRKWELICSARQEVREKADFTKQHFSPERVR